MSQIPVTSITLLKAISESADSVRWTEFYNRYHGVMRDYMRGRYPSVDADDAIQETMISLMEALPEYRQPSEDGQPHFRRYLLGILGHKAVDLVRRSAKQARIQDRLENERGTGLRMGIAADADSSGRFGDMRAPGDFGPVDDEEWRRSVMEVAISQLLADVRIQPATREVFRHVAVNHESPEEVARQFGITRNNVDQIKKRMIGKLGDLVRAMNVE